jgi:uncharacterized membrane protein HdeD (DUF308 family)
MSARSLSGVSGPWWSAALRGAVAILFGLAALLRPDITLVALVLLFGAYALVDGVFALVGIFGGADSGVSRPWLLVRSVAGIVAGLLAFVLPGLTALALLYLIAVWAIVAGIAEIVIAIELRKRIRGEWALIAGGAVSVAFGVILALLPWVGILSLVWLIGAYAIAFGVLLLITAFRMRGHETDGNRPSRVS